MALGSSRVSELIRVRVRSDGDPNHRPEGTEYERTPVDLYLQKLGTKWLQEIGGIIDPGEHSLIFLFPMFTSLRLW